MWFFSFAQDLSFKEQCSRKFSSVLKTDKVLICRAWVFQVKPFNSCKSFAMGAYVITCTSKFRVLWQYHNTHTH
jgi:hypothetical protein